MNTQIEDVSWQIWEPFTGRGKFAEYRDQMVAFTVSRGEIGLSKAAWERLGSPQHVQLLSAPSKKLIGLRAADEKERKSFAVVAGKNGAMRSMVRINAKRMLTHLGLGDTGETYVWRAQMFGDTLVIDTGQTPTKA